MAKYKFKVNQDGFYSGYGTDGTIAFDEQYNLSNLPTENHYYDKKWVLDNTKKREKDKEQKIILIKQELEELDRLMSRNELWYKEAEQSTLEITYEDRKLDLTERHNNKKKELLELTSL